LQAGVTGATKFHIYGEKLDQLIASSQDEKHFRSLWNRANNMACLMC
jgi:hypothetical protein